MLECEARTWLKNGYTTKAKVAELRNTLSRTRSSESIDALIEEMRKQWVVRRDWMEPG